MADDNPDFHPEVGDSVWYDYNDDWAEATVKQIHGSTYTLDVEGVGIVEGVNKEDMLPVEFEDEEGEEEEDEEEGEEADVDEDLRDLLDSAGLGILSFTLASAGISSVDSLSGASDADLKAAGVTESGQRKKLLGLVADKADVPEGCILVSFPAGPLGIDINMVDGNIVVTSTKGNASEQGVAENDRLIRVGHVDLDVKLKNVPNEQKCGEVKKIVVSLPRPLNMVFEKDKSIQITAVFQAGALGLSVTNQPKRNNALCVTKAASQAAENGILIDDEIIALNETECRGVKSDEFKTLIQAAGRPFRLTVVRGGFGAPIASNAGVDKEAERKAKLVAEKQAIEDAKAKAKQDAENKKKQQSEEKKRKEEAARKKAEEAEEAEMKRKKKEEEELTKKKEEEEAEDAPKEFKLGQEVWYDNGEDWVEATITTMGELVTLELRDTGEEVEDVEKEWLAPMEYEDGDEPKEDEEEEEEPEKEEDDALNMLASMKVSNSATKKKDTNKEDDSKKKAEQKAAEAREKAKAAEAKARKAAADKKAAADAKAKAKKAGSGGGGNGFRGRKSHMSKFASSVDKEVAVDHMHRARTARMSYAAMITYASFHAKKKEEEEQENTFLKKKVRKARSKSIEKKGPQIHDGESEYQYLMRKKREEAFEEELRKEEQREEQARLREEKFMEQEEYRRQLEEEYGPQYDDEEYDD